DLAEDAVGDPGDGVLLEDRGGHAGEPRHEHHRPRGVAADAEHHVGAQPPQKRPRLPKCPRDRQEPAPRPEKAPGLEAGDADELERIAELRDDPDLDAALGADEGDGGVRVAARDLLGHRDAGKEVPSRAAAGDQRAHARAPTITARRLRRFAPTRLTSSRLRAPRGRRWPTSRSSPARYIDRIKDDPP